MCSKIFFFYFNLKNFALNKKCPLFSGARGGGVENCLVFAVFDNAGMIKQ